MQSHRRFFCGYQSLIEPSWQSDLFWIFSHYDVIVRQKTAPAEENQRPLLHHCPPDER